MQKVKNLEVMAELAFIFYFPNNFTEYKKYKRPFCPNSCILPEIHEYFYRLISKFLSKTSVA